MKKVVIALTVTLFFLGCDGDKLEERQSFEQQFNQAKELFQNGQYAKAESIMLKVLDGFQGLPDSAKDKEAHVRYIGLLAEISLESGEGDPIGYANEILSLSDEVEDEAFAYKVLGHGYFNLELFKKAQEFFEKALPLSLEAYGPSHLAVAELYLFIGNSILGDFDSPENLQNLISGFSREKTEDYDESWNAIVEKSFVAKKFFNKCLEITEVKTNSEDARLFSIAAYVGLGKACYFSQEKREGKQHFNQAERLLENELALDPNNEGLLIFKQLLDLQLLIFN